MGNAGKSGGGSSSSSASKKGDAFELGKEWKRNLQKEARKIDRDILNIKRQEDRAMKECQKLAKANQLSAAKILAKEIVRTRKTTERMYTTKAQLNSVANNLQTSMSMMKLSGCMEKSTEIMGAMNKLINVRELRETMSNMAREMERTGLVDEIIGDAMDSMDEGIEAEADLEVEKVITELTSGVMSSAGTATRTIAKPATATATSEAAKEEAEIDANTEELLKRLQAL